MANSIAKLSTTTGFNKIEITIENNKAISYTNLKFPIRNSKYPTTIQVVHSPTANCQVSSICLACNLLTVDPEFEKELFISLYDICPGAYMVDIHESFSKNILKLFEKHGFDEIFSVDYSNTTGSEMVMKMLRRDDREVPDPEDEDYYGEDEEYDEDDY